MDSKRYTLVKDEGAYITASSADRLIASADADSALLFIYLLRHAELDVKRAARELKRTEAEIEKTAERLEGLGLISGGRSASSRPLPADEVPEYTADEIYKKARDDDGFRAVVDEAQHALGRMLSGADLKILFGMYDYLGLPPEVILLLINHCVTRTRRRQGPGRTPSMRTIEKEAYIWANREIITLDRAEAYLEEQRRKSEALVRLRGELGVQDRDFTPSERKYAENWLDMGFSPEALAVAYDRTVLRKGKLVWPYMDSIVRNWHEKGLHSPDEIEKGDSPQKAAKPSGETAESEDVEYLKRLFDEMKQKG